MMNLEVTAKTVSPLPLGEVGSLLAMRSLVKRGPGEWLRPIERPQPLTATLSPWGRGQASNAARDGDK
jgi:hypothetical protein